MKLKYPTLIKAIIIGSFSYANIAMAQETKEPEAAPAEAEVSDEDKIAKIEQQFILTSQAEIAQLVALQENLAKATDYSSVKTAKDIDALTKMINIYLTSNTALTGKIKTGWLELIKKELDKQGIKDELKAAFIKGFSEEMKKQQPHLLAIRDTDKEICQAVLKQHTILKKNYDKWEWNAEEGIPAFSDESVLKLYNAQAINIQKASIRQVKAQTALEKL